MVLFVAEMFVLIAVGFLIVWLFGRLGQLGREDHHRHINRRPGWLERSPDGSGLQTWRESPGAVELWAYDRRHHKRRR